MKKHLLLYLFALVCIPGLLPAQSFSIPNPSYLHTSDLSTNTDAVAVPITNATNFDIDVIVQKTVNNLAPFHSSQFCFGTACYDSSASASGVISFTHNATELLLADLNKNGVTGYSCVTYRIYDTNNPNDFADVEICYDVTTGIPVIRDANFISLPQPNPADRIAAVNYLVSGNYSDYRVSIFNILGNKVKEISLSARSGILFLPVSELTSGVYFYSLISNNKTISTNRLVVAHRD